MDYSIYLTYLKNIPKILQNYDKTNLKLEIIYKIQNIFHTFIHFGYFEQELSINFCGNKSILIFFLKILFKLIVRYILIQYAFGTSLW